MSLQTTEPLFRIPANSGQESVWQVTQRADLVLDPPYQRGSVWGKARQRNLIRSALLGIPFGLVFINQRRDFTDAVVDGKQRIETFRALFADNLDIPASWFEAEDYSGTTNTPDGPYVTWTLLTERGQGKVLRVPITVQRTNLATEQEEADLFDLVNFGGVPQGQQD